MMAINRSILCALACISADQCRVPEEGVGKGPLWDRKKKEGDYLRRKIM